MEAASSGDDAVLMSAVAEDQNLAVAWSSQDDKNLLRALHDLNFPTWHLIADLIFKSSKTAIACRERVTQLKRSQPESIPAQDVLYWTKLEDTSLISLARDDTVTTWNEVADNFVDPLKNTEKCLERYNFLAEKINTNISQVKNYTINNKGFYLLLFN
jgi:hypothetical protein